MTDAASTISDAYTTDAEGPRRAESRAIIVALIPCLLATIALGLLSDGVHHDDDLAHYLMARWVRWFPEYLLHIWGRPGLTAPLAAVAWIGDPEVGWHAARVLSAFVTGAAAWIAARLALRLGLRRAWLVVLLCYAQPSNVLLACTTLTENFTALYLIAAAALLTGGRPIVAAALFSVALVTRHETAALLPIWLIAVARTESPRAMMRNPRAAGFSPRGLTGTSVATNRARQCRTPPLRRLIACAAAVSAPIVHNLVFFAWFRRWPVEVFLAHDGSTEYPGLGALGYVPPALHAVSPFLAGLALYGGVAMVRRGQALLPVLAGAFFLVHCAIKTAGAYASGGYPRFMVAVAPCVAVCAAAGAEALWARLRARRPWGGVSITLAAVWIAGLLAVEIERAAGRLNVGGSATAWTLRGIAAGMTLLSIAAMFPLRRGLLSRLPTAAALMLVVSQLVHVGLIAKPLRRGPAQHRVTEVVRSLDDTGLRDAPVFACNPWFALELGLVEDPVVYKGPNALAAMPVGTLLIWDSKYAPTDYHRLYLPDLLSSTQYEMLATFPATADGAAEMRVFRKIAPTPPPAEPPPPYPPHLMSRRATPGGLYYIRPGNP